MNKFVVKIVEIKHILRGAWLTIRFIKYLNKIEAFNTDNPAVILKVIQGFLDLVSNTYTDKTIIMSRSINQSSVLLSALIDKWFRDKSNNTLEQILEVIRNEFIGRDNGR